MKQDMDLKRYLDVVRRRWWLLLLLVALTVAVTYKVTPRASATYEATTTLAIGQQSSTLITPTTTTGSATAQQSITSQVALITSPQVLRRAAAKLYGDSSQQSAETLAAEANALSPDVQVFQSRDSSLVTIVATGGTHDIAVRRANAVADAFVEELVDERTTALNDSLVLVSKQIQTLQDYQSQNTRIDTTALAGLQSQISDALAGLNTNLTQLQGLSTTDSSANSPARVAVISSMQDRLARATATLDLAIGEMTDLQKQEAAAIVASAQATTPSQIVTGLQAASGAMDRAAQPLPTVSTQIQQADVQKNKALVDLPALQAQLNQAASDINAGASYITQAANTPGLLAFPTQLQDLSNSFTQMVPVLNDLAYQVGSIQPRADGTYAPQQLQLIANKLTGAKAIVGVVSSQLKLIYVNESSVTVYGLLLSADQNAQLVATTTTGAAGKVLSLVNPPVDLAPSQLALVRDRIASLSADAKKLAGDVQALKQGPVSTDQKQLLAQRASALGASLTAAMQQLTAVRNLQQDPLIYGQLFAADEQGQIAIAALTDVSARIQELDRPLALTQTLAPQAPKLLLALQSVRSTLGLAATQLQAVRTAADKGLPAGADAISSVVTQIGQADSMLQSLATQSDALRTFLTTADNFTVILMVNAQTNGVSSTLKDLSTQLTAYQSSLGADTVQWLDATSTQTSAAIDALKSIQAKLDVLQNGSSSALTAAWTSDLNTQLRNANSTLDVIATDLQRAGQGESDAGRSTQLALISGRNTLARSSLSSVTTGVPTLTVTDSSATTLYNQLAQTQKQLQLTSLLGASGTQSSGPTLVISDRAAVAVPVAHNSARTNMLLAGVVGLLLGVLAALALEIADRRLRTQADIKRQVGLPVVGVIPMTKRKQTTPPQLTQDGMATSFTDAFRMLRTGLEVVADGTTDMVLLTTSPGGKDGKSTVAMNLARSLAMERRKVLLIDANLRKPEVASAFQLSGGDGLATALRNSTDPLQAVNNVDGVHVLPAGEVLYNSTDLLSPSVLKNLLQRARADYEVVVLDGPPVIGFPETLVLAKYADGVILVMRSNRTTYEEAKQAVEVLRSSGTKIVGAVLNAASDKEAGALYRRDYMPQPGRQSKGERPVEG